MRFSSVLSIVMGVAILAACRAESPTSSPAPESLSPVMAERYRCDTVPFQPGILLEPGNAEREVDAAADALRTFLTGPLNDGFMPATGWRRLGRKGDFVEFANFVNDPAIGGYVWITFEFDDARWNAFRWGSCQPRRIVPGGLESLAWWLPNGMPDPTDRSLSVNVIVDGCNAGPDAEAIQPPLIELSDDKTTVILTGRRLGRQGCPDGLPTPWMIDLPEELGGRAILDGSVFPGRDATTEPLGFGGAGG